MIGTLFKLAFAGIRTRHLASILTVVLTGAVAATIVLTLEVGSTMADPWARTFEAANGAHVLANVTTEAEASSIAGFDGVVESNTPAPTFRTEMIVDDEKEMVFLNGLRGEPAVNKPVIVEGSGDLDGGILFERSLANALGIDIGSGVSFRTPNGIIDLPVVGTAILPSQPRYPRSNPGLAWVREPVLRQIEPDETRWHWLQSVRLENPLDASQFAAKVALTLPQGSFSIQTWQDQRDEALREAEPIRLILGVYTLLLLIVSYSVIAILIGARVTGQRREIALLRAIGLTPRQVSAVFIAEASVVSLVGILVGFVAGAAIAPHLAHTASATLAGSPSTAAKPVHVLIAAVAILPVVAISAYGAARRSTRTTVQQSLRDATAVGGTNSVVFRALAILRVPISIELGLKDLLAKRSRALWLMLAIIVTSAAIVVTMSVQAVLNERPVGEPTDVPSELPALIFILDAVLAIVALTALIGVALLSVRERVREFGVLRTIGLTPSQVTFSLAGAHAVLAVIASLVSIPIGVLLYLVLYQTASGESATGVAPWWWLALVPIAMMLATALTTSIPAKLAARIPAAEAVRYE